jgi:hypothetical protein
MTKHDVLRPLVAALVLFTLGACGDDDPGPTGAQSRLIREADPICRDAFDRIDALGEPTDNAARRAALEQEVQIRRDLVEQVQGLSLPSEEREVLNLWLAQQINVYHSLEGVFHALAIDDRSTADRFEQQANEASERAAEAGRKYGFRDCAEPRT